jgi:hypothetical protein
MVRAFCRARINAGNPPAGGLIETSRAIAKKT